MIWLFFPKIWVKSKDCFNHVYVYVHGGFISVGVPEEVRRSSEMDDPVLSIAFLSEVSIERFLRPALATGSMSEIVGICRYL